MAANLNHKLFFDAVRARPFPGSLKQSQVVGMSTILQACPPDLSTDSLGYCLATTYWETAFTMQPVKERGGNAYYFKMYDIGGSRPEKARELGNVHPGDGVLFCGRGDVQLTGRSNYERATNRLRHLPRHPSAPLIRRPRWPRA